MASLSDHRDHTSHSRIERPIDFGPGIPTLVNLEDEGWVTTSTFEFSDELSFLLSWNRSCERKRNAE